MQFYEFEGLIANEEASKENDDLRMMYQRARKIAQKSESFNKNLQKKAVFFVSDISKGLATIGIFCRESFAPDKHIAPFLKAIGLELKDTHMDETTFGAANRMLHYAERNAYISSEDEILERFDLHRLGMRCSGSVDFGENLIDEGVNKDIYKDTERFLAKDSLIPELDRIYAEGPKTNAKGHPVHYIVQTDERETRKGMYKLLLQALYENGRLRNRRYCFIDFSPDDRFSRIVYDDLYKSNIGGTIIVRYFANDDTENEYASSNRDIIERLCEMMKKYRNQVLTVFCLPRECTSTKKIFYENLGSVSFVELKEEFASGERAKDFLKMLAKDNGVRTDKRLFEKLDNDEGYLAPELHDIFDEWYNRKLKTDIYPQYKEIETVKREVIKTVPKGSAYDELMEMVGLDEAKKLINQALNYYKAQRIFAEKGMKPDRPAMHMVFTGNPGTAKTTVARLFARIMKENNLLSKGNIIEVGRGDLVGKYVGWTAPAIQKKFREAKGGVLFIDEAYSLVDDRNGSFGDEAINTIVQEMENHRDDVVVIFAGYPDKMDEFLQKNPGLWSRIAFHVPFSDYDTENLCDIADLIATQKGLKLSKDARNKLVGIFDIAKTEKDFGNGRYVRNIIEKAKMTRATRLLDMDFDSIGKEDVVTICAEDIEMPAKPKQEKRRIGF